MTIRIRGLRSFNNGGDGLRIEGDVHVVAEDILTKDNRGHGVQLLRHAPLMEKIGLPKETDPQLLSAVLQKLQQVPTDAGEETVRRSGLLEKFGKIVVDSSTFISNVLSISANPNVAEIIKHLSGGA
jgi:hypothetical protein